MLKTANMRCPNCGNDDTFLVTVKVTVVLSKAGVLAHLDDHYTDPDWITTCKECGLTRDGWHFAKE